MRELPRGTVTFLFTDIEGSTRLLEQLGAEAYAEALADHRQVIRTACSAKGGVEVDTEGDALFVAFPTAQGALAAAAAFTEGLAEGPIRVRVGLHTGTPLVAEDDYVGIDVHRAARIAAAGHGGQVLVSSATAALTGSEGLRDLGPHRFKDLAAPERVYQLGEGEFPRLKTLYQTNLPVQPTALVGREAELAEVLELLATSRFLTLTGAGGSGKTRLALQAAAELVDDYKDGVWWVSLAAVRDPELVDPKIAQVVGAKDGLVEHLRSRQALLVLDNFEQLLEAGTRIAAVLAEAPDVRVFATSRERLGLSIEQEYPVPTLVPAEAVALFTARARQLKPSFHPDQKVEEVCRRLDGLPLALELAAARTKVLTSSQILERLGRGLDLLTAGSRDAPERQQTLRATIDWSYELLSDEERQLFARLGVFAGSFDINAAEAICAATLDELATLVDKSLLRQTDEGRFFMLETIREYSAQKLREAGESDRRQARHAEYVTELVCGVREPYFASGTERASALEQLETENENARQALGWLLERDEPEEAGRLCAAISSSWLIHGNLVEARTWIDRILDEREALSDFTRARLLVGHGYIENLRGAYAEAEAALNEGLVLLRACGAQHEAARALLNLGYLAVERGSTAHALSILEESAELYEAAGDEPGADSARQVRALALSALGEDKEATRIAEECVAFARRSGIAVDAGIALGNLAEIVLNAGDYQRTESLCLESLAGLHGTENLFVSAVILNLGVVAAHRGRSERAACLLGAAERLRQETERGIGGGERAALEETLDLLRSALTEEVLAAAWKTGREMSVDEAVDYALAGTGSSISS